MADKKILLVAGARPNFMKIAPIIKELKHKKINYYLVHTGQHYDEKLSKIFFEELEIPKPDINLNVGSNIKKENQIEEIQKRFLPILEKENPNAVIVVGDVNSTIACASVAKEKGIKVIHVEAGLRSFDKNMPEEINRIKTDAISDFLFITEKEAHTNLIKEGISPEKIFFVGNVMIDSLKNNLEKITHSKIMDQLNLEKGNFIVFTLHRPSNVDKKENLLEALEIIEEIQKEIKIVFPIHPRTKKAMELFSLEDKLKNMKNLLIIPPLGYLDFMNLVLNSKLVLTDSGGIQEETTYLKIPCITMRYNTERPSTINQGTNILVGRDKEKTLSEFTKIKNNQKREAIIPEKWDGKAAERIVQILIEKI